MKLSYHLRHFPAFCLIFMTIFISCNDMEDFPDTQPSDIIFNEKGKLYILSEGLFNMNNSSLQQIDYDLKKYSSDFFTSVNNRGLGDTGNDMILYKGMIFIVVNVSSQIEVIDAGTGLSVRRIPVMNEEGKGRQPRNIIADNDKIYICSFDGTVSRIDLKTLSIEATINAGKNPDGITTSNGYLYVSNSGGLDAPNYGKSVSKIDIATFSNVKNLDTSPNPYTLQSDSEGDVYLISRGNYGVVSACFQKIGSNDIVQTVQEISNPTDFRIFHDTAYIYSYNDKTGDFRLITYDCKKESIIRPDLLSGDFSINKPYGIFIHPISRRIYLTNVVNHSVKGDLFCFDPEGRFIYSIGKIGLNPHAMVWTE